MANELIKTNFELPKWDAKKVTGIIFATALIAAAAYGLYIYVLPLLLGIAIMGVKLAVMGVVGIFLFMTFMNPKFWRGLRYFAEALSQATLGLAIEMNPWNILNLQIEGAEKDREELRKQGEKLKANQASLEQDLGTYQKMLSQSGAEIKVAQKILATKPDDLDTQLALETSSTNFNNAQDFINDVKPIYNDILKLVDFSDKAYRKSGNALLNAKSTLKAQKAKYNAVTAGSNAMRSAMRAFTGDTNLNNDAELALQKLRKDVAGKIGGIKSSIQITSQFMNQQDLKDAGKVQLAIDTINQLDVDKTFNYGDTVKTSVVHTENLNTGGGNKFLDLLK